MPTETVSENALGIIPTEKLIQWLLQELATRVEKLETRGEAMGNLTMATQPRAMIFSPQKQPFHRTTINQQNRPSSLVAPDAKSMATSEAVNLLHMDIFSTVTRP